SSSFNKYRTVCRVIKILRQRNRLFEFIFVWLTIFVGQLADGYFRLRQTHRLYFSLTLIDHLLRHAVMVASIIFVFRVTHKEETILVKEIRQIYLPDFTGCLDEVELVLGGVVSAIAPTAAPT